MTTGGVSPDVAERLASRWFSGGATVVATAGGGFGGCPPWIVRDPLGGRHVLKAFPPGTNRERAEWVHRLVAHVRAAGVAELPPHRPLAGGGTLAADADGRLWELAAFVAGGSVERPSPAQVAAGMRLLARFHAAAATMPGSPPDRGPSRAIADRAAGAARMLEQPWRGLVDRPCIAAGDEATVARERLTDALRAFQAATAGAALEWLAGLPPVPLARQVVLRDSWHAHVLFDGDRSPRIAGLVDPHAAGIDTPATDLSRLLGSWLPADADDPRWWGAAIAAYEEVRPLAAMERRLIPILAASGVVLGLDNWFRWILCEGRRFGGGEAVGRRLDRLVEALPTALAVLAERSGPAAFDR